MERQLEIDTLRGIACLLLVIYHVIGEPVSGLKITEGWIRDANDYLAYIRMPLFTFLSGFVYAWRPFRSGAASFLAGKVRRLLLPMLVVGTTFAVVQALVPGANGAVQNWYLLHIEPVAHFWFLESLFLIFLLLVAVESLHLLDTGRGTAIAFAAACAAYLFIGGSHYFSLAGAIYLLPYFLAGLACCRFALTGRTQAPILAVLFCGALAFLIWQNAEGLVGQRSPAALLVGVTGCALLISAGLKSRALAFIGLSSYAIYLFHTFFTAASRIVLLKLGVHDLAILLLCGLTAGVAGPMFVERLASQNRLTNTLLLGKKWTPSLSWIYPLRLAPKSTAQP